MGTPCGPTLANIFLCYHEKKWLQDCPIDFKPQVYKRYVDDTFLLFKNETQINNFLNYLNSQHNNIEFTSELEQDSTLPFLDLKIQKTNTNFVTSIYRKDTFTGLGTHFLSYESIRFKINSIKTLIYRAYKLSSSYVNFHLEIEFLSKFFQSNGFPVSTFHKQVKDFLNRMYSPQASVPTVSKRKVFCSLPYYGYITDQIKSDIKSIVDKHLPQIDLQLIFVNNFHIGSFFKHKEKLAESLCSGVVYDFECMHCNMHYIGSTARQLPCRIAEHMGISVRTNRPLATIPNSSIFQHEREKGHRIQKSNFKIISFVNKASLRTVEALHIVKNKPKLNSGLPLELFLIH